MGPAGPAQAANPQFSPDDQRVAFTSGRSGNPEIWVADEDGSNVLRLTSLGTTGSVGSPRWSPDGSTIVFDFSAQAGDSNADIFVVSASGGSVRRITGPLPVTSPRPGRVTGAGSTSARTGAGSGRCGRSRPPGSKEGAPRQVTRGGGFAPTASPDDRHVYFARGQSSEMDPENSIWRIQVDGGDEQVVVESLRSSFGQWGLTAEGIYFIDQEPSSAGAR